MNSSTLVLLAVLAAQHPVANGASEFVGPPAPPVPVEVWPYYTAIGALATAVVTLFGVIMRMSKTHAEELKVERKAAMDMLEERSKRQGEEFKGDKQTIVELSTKLAGLVEKVAGALDKSAEANTTHTAAISALREELRR